MGTHEPRRTRTTPTVQDNNENYLYYRNRRRRRHTARRRGRTPKTAPRVRKEAAPQTRRGTHHNNQLNEKNLLPKYRVAQNRYDTTTNYQHFQRGRRRSRRHPTKKTTESGKEIRMSPQNYHTYQRARRRHNHTTKGQRASCRPTN